MNETNIASKATPRPWKLDSSDNILAFRVGQWRSALFFQDTDNITPIRQENAANAALIVRSVNEHEALNDAVLAAENYIFGGRYVTDLEDFKKALSALEAIKKEQA